MHVFFQSGKHVYTLLGGYEETEMNSHQFEIQTSGWEYTNLPFIALLYNLKIYT